MRAWLLIALIAVQRPADPRGFRPDFPPLDDGKRELTLTGCLLRSGYAGYQIDEAQLDAIDGKPVAKDAPSNTPAPPKKWILDGGGNLGASTGRKVQVVGRSDWRAEAAADDPPNRTPHLDVKTVKTIADRCS